MNHSTPALTLGTAADAFLEHFADQVRRGLRSDGTLCMHREHTRWLLSHLPPSTALAAITTEVVVSVSALEARGRRGRSISGGTLRKRLSTLRLCLAHAHRRGWLAAVPAFPDVEHRYRPRTEHLRDADELAALCAELPGDRAEWVIVAVFTGQHPADVHRMRAFVDADPFAPTPWWIRRNSKNRGDGKRLVMPGPLAEVLRARFDRLRLRHGDPIVHEWPKDQRTDQLRRACRRAGIQRVTATSLRRTCGSWAVHELGSITRGVQEWLDHRSLQMLEKVYAHALPPALLDVAAALERMVERRPPLTAKLLPGGTVPPGKKAARSVLADQPGRGTNRGAHRSRSGWVNST